MDRAALALRPAEAAGAEAAGAEAAGAEAAGAEAEAANFFFFGSLCHAPLLDAVLGRPVAAQAAVLDGHAARWAEAQAFPVLVAQAGGQARGVLVRGLSADDVARLEYYAGSFVTLSRDVVVRLADAEAVARVFVPDLAQWRPAATWHLVDWQRQFGAAAVATAVDFMRHMGQKPAAEVRARYGMMLTRGASRLRAEAAAPAQQAQRLRFRATGPDVQIDARREPYARFFAVEEYDLRFRRFDGAMSRPVIRAAFVSGDAVTVLPYDPQRDRVLLIEQFRTGPLARGDAQPWQLEAIAGRIDAGETPEDAARREATEEAGLALGALLPVAGYYPSPGAMSEYLYSFVALCELPDQVAGVFGVAHEAEDIRGHLLGFDDLMALLVSGEVANAPLILTALWLQRERARLRQTGEGGFPFP